MTAGPDYCGYLGRVGADNLAEMSRHIASDVHFKDPFNDVVGIEKMRAIFEDMFKQVENLKFDIHERFDKDSVTVITWTLSGRLMGKPWSVDGTSRLIFDAEGMLTEHVDFWDAAGGLYERFPIIGWLLRRLRRKLEV